MVGELGGFKQAHPSLPPLTMGHSRIEEDPISLKKLGSRAQTVCGGKGRQLADMMERRKMDILCVQKTRWKGSKARSIGAGFKLFYYGMENKRNWVGVVLKEEFVRNVLEVKRVSDRVMSLKLETEGVMLNVVSGYAPQVGCGLEEKERFWSELDEVMESIPMGERVVIGADFNGHVGDGNRGDEEVMGKFGVKERNLEGQMVVDFAKRMDMAVVNTYFQKREAHRVTYKSGGRSTQKYRDGQSELHYVFVDLEKAYDRVPREDLWYCMRKSGVAEKYVRVEQDMYERSRTVVRCAVGQTEEFKVEVGLHQGSALSPFLFAMVMDQLSEEIRQESPCTMMFADDIVICSESREQVEENLERWRFALEKRGMKVSRSKTEYMCVNEREGSGTVRLQGEEVKKVQEFKYLGSTVQSNGECGKEKGKMDERAAWVVTLLMGTALEAYAGMDAQRAGDYDDIKAAVLAKYNVMEEAYQQCFRSLYNTTHGDCERDLQSYQRTILHVNLLREFKDRIPEPKDQVTMMVQAVDDEEGEGEMEPVRSSEEVPDLYAHMSDHQQQKLAEVDASDVGLGAVLTQGESGSERPMLFLSRKLFEREREAYRPLVRRSKLVLKQVKTWPAGAISALQDCFECIDWNMFREAATNGDSINLEEYTKSVTSYIGKCIDDMTVYKTITTRSNQKPWMTAEVHALLKSRDTAFRVGDKATLRTARAKLSQDSGDSGRMWQGIQAITNYKTTPDNIPGRVLRECAEQLTDVFTDIFNISLSSAVVPTCLKTTTIVPVPKNSTVSCLNDYRPIALTPIVMKCFERLAMRHIKTQLSPSLDPLQFAYHLNRSTDNAITTTLHLSLTHLDNKDTYVRMLFIDFSSAFNTIIPQHLIEKLSLLGLNTSLYN
ncbi:hypothetical protein QTP86_009973 [Hemibagrus guttatus]|nr:hypothetical protein QTP86_009973 [Hemibagrus guttatus]